MIIRKPANLFVGTHYDVFDSPIGNLVLLSSEKGLHVILWDHEYENPQWQNILQKMQRSSQEKTIFQTRTQLAEYFYEGRKAFELPLIFNGTAFQMLAWKALINIPYACTLSYAEQAATFSGKNKARAVGTANARNPIPIIIPCHRVINNNGKLGGFGGGIDKKIFLLNLERHKN